jgi:N-carbamoyl-L-amino-acid hydrolase
MDKRRNALVGAAHLIVAANDIGWRYHDSEGKSTAPRLICWPNKPGILPEYAQVTIDFRHADPAQAAAMLSEFEAAIPAAAERAKVEIEIVERWSFGDETFAPEVIATLREAARELDVATLDILSQAGHDAYYMSRIAPTALVFSPCKDGITHNEAEHIELAYTLPSVNVLLNAVLKRANRG